MGDFEKLFYGLFTDNLGTGIKIQNDENSASVRIPLPGFTKDVIAVEAEHDVITVSCEKPHEKNPFQFKFKRQFRAGDNYDVESAKAELADGVLTITVPMKKERQKKKRLLALS